MPSFKSLMPVRGSLHAAQSARLFDLEVALEALEKAEAEYRRSHDLYGGDDLRVGRLWDRMRRCGDHARKLLKKKGGVGWPGNF